MTLHELLKHCDNIMICLFPEDQLFLALYLSIWILEFFEIFIHTYKSDIILICFERNMIFLVLCFHSKNMLYSFKSLISLNDILYFPASAMPGQSSGPRRVSNDLRGASENIKNKFINLKIFHHYFCSYLDWFQNHIAFPV